MGRVRRWGWLSTPYQPAPSALLRAEGKPMLSAPRGMHAHSSMCIICFITASVPNPCEARGHAPSALSRGGGLAFQRMPSTQADRAGPRAGDTSSGNRHSAKASTQWHACGEHAQSGAYTMLVVRPRNPGRCALEGKTWVVPRGTNATPTAPGLLGGIGRARVMHQEPRLTWIWASLALVAVSRVLNELTTPFGG